MASEWLALGGIVPAFSGGALLALAIDSLTRPRPKFANRPFAAWMLHFGLFALLFALEFAVFQRPWFAAASALAWQLLIVLVSNAKFASLREPFIFQDFEYFLDAIKHPRLYLPFLGAWRAALATLAFIVAITLGLMFEPPITRATGAWPFVIAASTLFFTSAVLIFVGASRRLIVTHDPAHDVRELGLLASLWRYRADERAPIDLRALPTVFNGDALARGALRPNIIVIQSESFFDARRLHPGLDPSLFREWDRTHARAAAQGRMHVAAWGANTVRTEFSFLSGLQPTALGVHRFNPYRKFAHQGVATLASTLRNAGYKTICVHPFPASFYARNMVFPKMGFDTFIDISSFNGADKSGPYIGDLAVARKIETLLDQHDQGVFIFAITMENHGPLHWESVNEIEKATLFSAPPSIDCDELAVYARHLRNADAMLGQLRARCETAQTPHWLCQYGDHVPIMPAVYAALGEPDGTTDYVLWGNQASVSSGARDIDIADLAALLLAHVAGDHAAQSS